MQSDAIKGLALSTTAPRGGEPERASGDQPSPSVSPRGPLSSPFKTFGISLLAFLLILTGIFFGGFLRFTHDVAMMEAPVTLKADGIVALTGGAERIAAAVDLLDKGHARRLLISGVHPDTSARAIGKTLENGAALLECCVDLDRRAANTIGNAMETAKWADHNDFRSLIVVTSAYHMPRSLMELKHAMPGVRLLPYPVAPDRLTLDRWWNNDATTALLLEEYTKYLATRVRLLLTEEDAASSAFASMAQ